MERLALCIALFAPWQASDQPLEPTTDDDFERVVRPFLAAHCTRCHAGDEPEAELDLAAFDERENALAQPEAWLTVREQLARGTMPPTKLDEPTENAPPPAPTEDDVRAVLSWIDAHVAPREPESVPSADPPRLRRLTNLEYENTLRDLFGVGVDAAGRFPTDEVGGGFDNDARLLHISDVLLEGYLEVAEEVAAELFREEPAARGEPAVAGGALFRTRKQGHNRRGDSLVFSTSGEAQIGVKVQTQGTYEIHVRAFAQQAGDEAAQMALRVDETELQRFSVEAVPGSPEVYTATVELGPGMRRFGIAFLNDYYRPEDPDPNNRDRNLVLESFVLAGPLEPPRPSFVLSEARRAVNEDSIEPFLAALGRRVYRRPLASDELSRLAALARETERPIDGLRLAFQALLVSPHFLFRRPAADPTDPYDRASRLSFFLWSSAPDEELLDAAADGTLDRPDGVELQIRRMLRDPRASAVATSFAPQWLGLMALETVSPDLGRFDFDDDLRAAMRSESELVFEVCLREGRPIGQLLSSDFTFVNERLARHYGIPGVRGPHMRRVRLDTRSQGAVRRGGILTQAGVLTVTSNPTRTSPVLRGKWILETILGTPPEPPPPGVADLMDDEASRSEASLRQRLEAHRSDPACAACHAEMDPLGFGLENYDAVGRWREVDGRFPVDANGTLPDGRPFEGAVELGRLLGREPAFLHTLAQALASYALGRELRPDEEPLVEEIIKGLESRDPLLRELVQSVALQVALFDAEPEAEEAQR